MGRIREVMSSWKAGDFFRQLATVIIGIVVTFGGSALIQRSAERKEARHLLTMVRSELQLNKKAIEDQIEWHEHELAGVRAFFPYLENPGDVPIDTLVKYSNIMSSIVLSAHSNAFQMLKTSSAVQSMNDKRLLLDLFKVYSNLDANVSNVRGYVDSKTADFDIYYQSIERDEVEMVFGMADPMAAFAHMTGHSTIAQYVTRTTRQGWLSNITEQMKRTVKDLEEMDDKIENFL
ncbi:MAG: hypothetical protein LBV18_00620 [Alistipes sp.]|jgi:hypothetical protein|nr:hypothetical protein [Alistipes sp.]